MKTLVLNCGSSSVKFQIIDTDQARIDREADRRLARGMVERLGDEARVTLSAEGRPSIERTAPLRDQRAALEEVLRWVVSTDSGIDEIGSPSDIAAVGHRVVHGGEEFKESARIDDDVLAGIERCIDLAPLHNPANIAGIRAAGELLGRGIPQVAVFDTTFHATLPETSFLYGIPYEYYLHHRIRRYGFHGTSHRYVSHRYRTMLRIERHRVNVITLHLGNGCSACAIKGGDSFDTSMGFTPLEGLLMGTRSGDIDASILDYLERKESLTVRQLGELLNERSGLLGLSGASPDMRTLLEREGDDHRARLAIEVFCHRARKYVGAYYAAMKGADAVVFTGGIGENSPIIRRRICDGLESLGLRLDPLKNDLPVDRRGREISATEATLKAYVIPTDEELMIARDTYRVIASPTEP